MEWDGNYWRGQWRGVCGLHCERATFVLAHCGLTPGLTAQVPPLEAISQRARASRTRLDWVLHDDAAHHTQMHYVASQSDVCLVFVSLFLVENWDRDGGVRALRLDRDGEAMIRRVADSCAGRVVVVMHIGGQVFVEDWVSKGQGEGRERMG